MTDRPDRVSQPSPGYDSWQHGESPTIPPTLFPTPMGLPVEDTSNTLPSPPPALSGATEQALDLIPGAALREILVRLEAKLDGLYPAVADLVTELSRLGSVVERRPCLVQPPPSEPACPISVAPRSHD